MIWPAGRDLPARGRRNLRAFSSIEFLAAAVFMAILTAMAVTGYFVFERRMPVKYGSQEMLSAFSAARAFAIGHNRVFAVQIDRGSRNFWIDQTDATGLTVVPKVVSPEVLDDRVVIDSILRGGVEAPQAGGISTVRFFPDGSSDDVSVFLRIVGDDRGPEFNTYTVRVYGPTGQAKVFENRRVGAVTP